MVFLICRLQVVEESQAALAWLKEKQELQAQLGKHEDPVLVSADIKKKEDTLRRVADPILSEKPPPPPKVRFTVRLVQLPSPWKPQVPRKSRPWDDLAHVGAVP